LGWSDPATPLLFPARPCGSLADTGPRLLAFPGSSSRELAPLFRVRPAGTCTSLSLHAPSLRFLSSFATSTRRVHHPANIPGLPLFRPQRFSRSRRFTPHRTLQACFIPQPRPRFTPQGLPPTISRAGSSPAVALLSFPSRACTEQARCASSRRPTPGLCSDRRSVVADELFRLADTRSPLEFSLPQVFLRAPWRRLRVSSAHDLDCQLLAVTPAIGLRRINQCSA